MEEIQLDYGTLVSVYQSKVTDLINQNILLEAKNIILTKKIQELSANSYDSYGEASVTDASTPTQSRKKTQTSDT